MPKSRKPKKMHCQCGRMHVLALFNRESYDEWALPFHVVAANNCDEVAELLDALDMNKVVPELLTV